MDPTLAPSALCTRRTAPPHCCAAAFRRGAAFDRWSLTTGQRCVRVGNDLVQSHCIQPAGLGKAARFRGPEPVLVRAANAVQLLNTQPSRTTARAPAAGQPAPGTLRRTARRSTSRRPPNWRPRSRCSTRTSTTAAAQELQRRRRRQQGAGAARAAWALKGRDSRANTTQPSFKTWT